MRHAHRLVLLLAALTALVLTAAAGVALTPAAHAAGAQNRVGAFIPRTQSLTRPAALESSCIRPGLIASTAGIAAGFCVAAEGGLPPIAGGAPMLGEGGTQVTSQTLLQTDEFHIDVENPAPGVRPGQLHLQDYNGNKYLYDFETGQFDGLPRSLQKQIANNPAVARAINQGGRVLGVSGG
jgi:hypothetical protein